MLSDWTRPLLAFALFGALVGLVLLLLQPASPLAFHGFSLTAFSLVGYLLGPRRQLHVTAEYLELVDSSRLTRGQVLRWPLQDVASLDLVARPETSALYLDLPDRHLTLLAPPDELERAAAMIREAWLAAGLRDRGSEQDVPEPLRQALRTPQRQ